MVSNAIKMQPTITKTIFGKIAEGQIIDLFTLQNEAGGVAQIINYGGIIVSTKVPDRNGELGEVMLGFDDLESYLTKNDAHFGSIIGRYANRIAKGHFFIDKEGFDVAKNNGQNHLHGGLNGFDRQIWKAIVIEKYGQKSLQLTYLSPDGEEGYPGSLACTVTYSFFENNELVIDYEAVTDTKTIVNLTSHPYFNLKNGGKSDVLTHELKINASHITAIDSTCIPTGKLMPVEKTPFDFRNLKSIGKSIEEKQVQLEYGNGFDHNFVIDATNQKLPIVAEVVESETGRTLTILTTEPGIQLYTGNWLDSKGKNGIHHQKRSAFCLETQHFPDSPNQPSFPSTILEVGDTYKSRTVYRFGVLK
jgi:aldose 1-epimerase